MTHQVYSDRLQILCWSGLRKSGGKAVIVSSVTRRSFNADGKIVSNLVKNEKVQLQGDSHGLCKCRSKRWPRN